MDPLDPADVARLREALTAATFTYDAVAAMLGPAAHSALSRNETTPGLRATADGSPLATMTRLWLLQASVPSSDAARALPGLVDALCAAGILECSVGAVRARMDVRPYADDDRNWWVVSDLTPGLDGAIGRVGADHVLGISSASTSLAQLTIREPFERALDLGTGCGVQSLHLADHVQQIVATDVNDRALWVARLNAALNQTILNKTTLDVRKGSLFEPVDGEVVRRIVTQAPAHLTPGGWCQVLANWVHHQDQSWQDRIAGWVGDTGCDAWVVQREVADPAQYVELWLKDAGLHGSPDYPRRYDTWLSWFEQQGVEGIGFGWFHLRRTGRERPVLRIEEWPYEVEQPLGPEVAAWGRRTDFVEARDDATLLRERLVVRPDIGQETVGEPGAEDPERIVIRQQRGMRRARQVDTAEAAFVGACDGELEVGQILDALGSLLAEDPDVIRGKYLTKVRELTTEGFLEPVALDQV